MLALDNKVKWSTVLLAPMTSLFAIMVCDVSNTDKLFLMIHVCISFICSYCAIFLKNKNKNEVLRLIYKLLVYFMFPNIILLLIFDYRNIHNWALQTISFLTMFGGQAFPVIIGEMEAENDSE